MAAEGPEPEPIEDPLRASPAAEGRETRVLYRAVLLAAGLLVLGLLFQELVTLLIGVLVTILIAIPLAAGADALQRFRLPRVVGVLATLLVALGILTGLGFLLVPPFAEETEQFIDRVPAIVDDLSAEVAEITGSEPSDVGAEVQGFLQGYIDNPDRLIGPLTDIGVGIVTILGAIVFALLTAVFIAVRPSPLVEGMLALFPPPDRERARGILARIRRAWVGWMQGVAVDMLVTGVLLFVGLRLIGLDFAIFFAVFAALLVVVPYFGAIAGGIPPILLALTSSPELALLTLAVYVAAQQIESNLVIPLVMSERVQLHPALIAVGVVVVGQLIGFIGLFVAVPLIALAVILADELWVKPTGAKHGGP